MTPKERMLTALNLGKPDRVPATTLDLMPYWLKNEMGGMNSLDSFKRLGLDASVHGPWAYDMNLSTTEWKVSADKKNEGSEAITNYTFDTPKGSLSLSQVVNKDTGWVKKYMIENDEDIKLLKYRAIPKYNKKVFESLYDELGDYGILRTGGTFGFQEGCWQDACELHGTEKMIMATYDKPEWVHEFLGILLEQKLKFIEESMPGLKVDLVLMGGGASSNTVISPAIHEEFCLPYDKEMNQAIKSYGHKIVYHTCGGMTKILDYILANGCDASESLSPANGGGDITDTKVVFDKFSGKLAMIGGLDQINLLNNGTPRDIRKEVFRLFEGYGKNGGYIMMACDHFFQAPKENLIAFASAAKECVY